MVVVARMTDENTEAEDIPELTDADLASAIRAQVRNRLMRGEIDTGNDIAALRRYVRLSPEDFAKAMGIGLHTLSSWEQAVRSRMVLRLRSSGSRPVARESSARTSSRRLRMR
jgi:DNA-binding transcriptional regulator YiaG